ncbi:MAG: cyanophycinase, partial [Acidobacteria bacterium]|nr:cyanophycinase [Acidobacteriota bacterium]
MSRGFIIPIGGAEEKIRDPEILRRFVAVCGGREARIAVIPTASQLEETGPKYRSLFLELGAKEVAVLPFATRADGSHGEWLAELEGADGVFMTGGNQLRLSTTLGGTPASDLLREQNARG